ncbi:hypothetical protein SAMN02745136_00515 [Anaerocolumna jejuensis DSM 15929]|uniref:Uncharacterized protein n=1 Tax=Anaerocolumna jejuensis DSM 15929 TaxID=1121322 RepID=A0A1M6KNB4_9FIRM|nr:hypothetical protein [Anaerocolumna jejuensis]SHJ60374.1 hypothetical protein SAMN02745136_00515 [Anaerocolumna jejuensis DSM 15929]
MQIYDKQVINSMVTFNLVSSNGQIMAVIEDKSHLLNRREWFNREDVNNPNYLKELKKAEKRAEKARKLGKDPIVDTTASLSVFGKEIDSDKFIKGFNTKLKADEKSFTALKEGKIIYAHKEIEELQYVIDQLDTEEDTISMMHWIQFGKRFKEEIKAWKAENENRDRMRSLGYDDIRCFPLSFLAQILSCISYDMGASAECLEDYQSLKHGYLNKFTQGRECIEKRMMCPVLESSLLFNDLSKFKAVSLKSGPNLSEQEHQKIADEFIKLGNIKAVVQKLKYTEKTVRKWVDCLVPNKELFLIA